MSDLISRKAAMDLFMGKPPDYYHSSYIVGEINSLPSDGADTPKMRYCESGEYINREETINAIVGITSAASREQVREWACGEASPWMNGINDAINAVEGCDIVCMTPVKSDMAQDGDLKRKVLDGLCHCLDGAAGCLKGCPYAEEKRCRAKLMQDALTALEEKE